MVSVVNLPRPQGIPPDDIFADDFAIEDQAVDKDDPSNQEDGFHDDDGGEDAGEIDRVRKRRRVEFEDDDELGSNFGMCCL